MFRSKVAADSPREADHQLYAEIREPSPSSSHTRMQNVGTSHIVTTTAAPAPGSTPPQYEAVTLDVLKSTCGGDYQFSQCQAYGL